MKHILIDLDGVLNKYTGDYEENHIPEPADNVEEFLKTLKKYYVIKIYTTRTAKLVKEWLKKHNLDSYIEEVTNTKSPCFAYIDDRAICFNGNFEDTIKQLNNFKPHWKK